MICNVLEYLEMWGKCQPDKIVFEDPAHEITYGECIQLARRIGTCIAAKSLGRRPVAILIDRNIESLVAFMGTVYSGNFYVPVSRLLPPERIGKILKKVDPVCFVTGKKDRDFAEKTGYQGEIFCYEDAVQTEISEELLMSVRKWHLDTDPLYAIYTSGSSGMPKGVLVSHRSVIDLVEQFASCFGFDQNEVFGNQAPFDFDVSVKDIYSTLRNGATLCVVTPKQISFPKLLIPYLTEKKVTTLIWAVSALAMTAAMKGMEKGAPPYLKKIMFSGEVMPVKVLNYWREKLPDAMFVNLYGPTEITCNCTYYIVDREFSAGDALPIGKAFPNTEILLLNRENRLCREGEEGEICVRGSSLALGYYQEQEITERAFCQNPLNHDYPERIYRTGDLGRMVNGELYYSGRRDFQIKHMGHRIELGEIEQAMDALGYVERSCCIYDPVKEKIWLFYQAKEDCGKRIAADLQHCLPKYMCPNRYRYLESLPLNKNGKIDRQRIRQEFLEEKDHA